MNHTELQIRRIFEDNNNITFFVFFNKKYVVTPHLNWIDQMALMIGHKICLHG